MTAVMIGSGVLQLKGLAIFGIPTAPFVMLAVLALLICAVPLLLAYAKFGRGSANQRYFAVRMSEVLCLTVCLAAVVIMTRRFPTLSLGPLGTISSKMLFWRAGSLILVVLALVVCHRWRAARKQLGQATLVLDAPEHKTGRYLLSFACLCANGWRLLPSFTPLNVGAGIAATGAVFVILELSIRTPFAIRADGLVARRLYRWQDVHGFTWHDQPEPSVSVYVPQRVFFGRFQFIAPLAIPVVYHQCDEVDRLLRQHGVPHITDVQSPVRPQDAMVRDAR